MKLVLALLLASTCCLLLHNNNQNGVVRGVEESDSEQMYLRVNMDKKKKRTKSPTSQPTTSAPTFKPTTLAPTPIPTFLLVFGELTIITTTMTPTTSPIQFREIFRFGSLDNPARIKSKPECGCLSYPFDILTTSNLYSVGRANLQGPCYKVATKQGEYKLLPNLPDYPNWNPCHDLPGYAYDIGAGACWKCPPAFPVRTGYSVTSETACRRNDPEDFPARYIKSTIWPHECDSGTFWDPREWGQCWQCPAYTDRTANPVTWGNACRGFRFSTAFLVKRWGCALYEGSFFDPNGNCYTCPNGYERSIHPVTGNEACISSFNWLSVREPIGMFNVPYVEAIIQDAIDNVDLNAYLPLVFSSRMLAGSEDPIRFLTEIKTNPGSSAVLNHIVFTRIQEILNDGATSTEEKEMIEFLARFVKNSNVFLAEEARIAYLAWKYADSLRQSPIGNMFGINSVPPNFQSIVSSALDASALPAAMLGTLMTFVQIFGFKVVLTKIHPFAARKVFQMVGEKALTKLLSGVSLKFSLSTLKALSGPIAIILVAVDIFVAQLQNVIDLQKADSSTLEAITKAKAEVINYDTWRSIILGNNLEAKENLGMNLFSKWISICNVPESYILSTNYPSNLSFRNKLFKFADDLIASCQDSSCGYAQVTCAITADNELVDVYVNGYKATHKVKGGEMRDWEVSKTFTFNVSKTDFPQSLAVKAKDAFANANSAVSGMALECSSSVPEWNFNTVSASNWVAKSSDKEDGFGIGEEWVEPLSTAVNWPAAVKSTSGMKLPNAKILNTGIWSSQTGEYAAMKLLICPAGKCDLHVASCSMTADNQILELWINGDNLTPYLTGNLNDWQSEKKITFHVKRSASNTIAIKAKDAGSGAPSVSGFSIGCSSQTYSAWNFNTASSGWIVIPGKVANDIYGFPVGWYESKAVPGETTPAQSTSAFSAPFSNPNPGGKIWSSTNSPIVAFKRTFS